MIKKADIVLFLILTVLGLIFSFWSLFQAQDGQKVLITVDGKAYGTYLLSEDQTVEINSHGHINNITIKDGKVSMSYSSCKNQICVNTGAISTAKDAIVCLPNRVVVEILPDSEGGDVDVIIG